MLQHPIQLKDFLAPYPLDTIVRLLVKNSPDIIIYVKDLFMFPKYRNILLHYVDKARISDQNYLDIILSYKPYLGQRPTVAEVLRILQNKYQHSEVRFVDKSNKEICKYHAVKTYLYNGNGKWSSILTKRVKSLYFDYGYTIQI